MKMFFGARSGPPPSVCIGHSADHSVGSSKIAGGHTAAAMDYTINFDIDDGAVAGTGVTVAASA